MGKTYDFDKAVDRRKTSCLKYDFGMKRKGRDDLLPLWVADMDFQLPEEILADFRARIDHGIFGYTDPDQEYFDALDHWFFTRHCYHVDPETVTVGCGVVYGLATGVKAFTKEGMRSSSSSRYIIRSGKSLRITEEFSSTISSTTKMAATQWILRILSGKLWKTG